MKVDLKMPKTVTPTGVYILLLFLAGVVWLVTLLFLPFLWSLFVTFIILGLTTKWYSKTIPGYYAHIIIDDFTKKMRVIFQGLGLKKPWEKPVNTIDLRTEIHGVKRDTYPTEDAVMQVDYVYYIRPDCTGENAGEKIIRYGSYEPKAIEAAGEALFSKYLSDYYRPKQSSVLKDKDKIQKEALESGNGLKAVEEFQLKHGVIAGAILKDSDFDEKTQLYRSAISGATSFREAIDALRGTDKKLSEEAALRVIKLMSFEGNVSEVMYDINLDSTGLENLRDIQFFGGGPAFAKNLSKNKKTGGK